MKQKKYSEFVFTLRKYNPPTVVKEPGLLPHRIEFKKKIKKSVIYINNENYITPANLNDGSKSHDTLYKKKKKK